MWSRSLWNLPILSTKTRACFSPPARLASSTKQDRWGLQRDVHGKWTRTSSRIRLVREVAHLPVGAAGQSGSTLNTSGWTATGLRVRKGDVFQIAGVYAVNVQSGLSTGRLRDFTVLADGTADAGGLISLSIAPAHHWPWLPQSRR